MDHKCKWREKWRSGNRYIYECSLCGRTRNVKVTQQDKEMVRNGDLLQPVGKDRDKFLEKYGYLPDLSEEENAKERLKRGIRNVF